jgi:hypothetical protein
LELKIKALFSTSDTWICDMEGGNQATPEEKPEYEETIKEIREAESVHGQKTGRCARKRENH